MGLQRKIGDDLLFAALRIDKAVDMFPFIKVFWRRGPVMIIKGVDDDQFHLHPRGEDALYVDACLLAGDDVLAAFRQSRKVGR